jgi:hypothetical protein
MGAYLELLALTTRPQRAPLLVTSTSFLYNGTWAEICIETSEYL